MKGKNSKDCDLTQSCLHVSKKANMRYWDEIDDIAMDCVKTIKNLSVKSILLEDDDILDLSKQVVEIVIEFLEACGCEYPYVDENY